MAMISFLRSKKFRAVVVFLFLAFVGIQFIRPKLPNPPVTAELQVPPEVRQILKTSCYNCHSNETRLPWFDKVAPAYWLVAADVKEARRHLNFSELGSAPAAQQKAELFEAVNQIQLNGMPLKSYKFVHPESVVTPGQLATLKNFLRPSQPRAVSESDQVAAAYAQYARWTQSGASKPEVAPSPNGIAFLPDYKNWEVVSTTDRFDNNTLRVILGNDVAMKAIKENHTNPWPDGTIFAKVAWDQLIAANGEVHSGEFKQVEFMIKDSKRYADTLGWGWARWRGMNLQPYGKTKSFANECVSCHRPLNDHDYTFTMPIKNEP